MKTIFSWRPEKAIFPRPALKKFKLFVREAVRLTRCGITGELSVTFVSAKEMEKANEELVGHTGLTDVICFDYREAAMPGLPEEEAIWENEDGESEAQVDLIVCPAAALLQADKRNIPYAKELALYVVHGLLHAAGNDDLKPALKRKMRRREKQTMDELEKIFDLQELFPEPVRGEARKSV